MGSAVELAVLPIQCIHWGMQQNSLYYLFMHLLGSEVELPLLPIKCILWGVQ